MQIMQIYIPAIVVLLTASLWAQEPGVNVKFDAASLKPSPPEADASTGGCGGGPMGSDPGQMDCKSAPLRMLVFFAYGVQKYQVIGPAWMDSALFDIKAKIPAGATRDQMKMMLRALLEERFHLSFHRETRQFQIYHLVVGSGGPKFAKSTEGPPSPRPSPPASPSPGYRRMKASMTLDLFAQGIGNLLGRPVINETGLTGKYDISLDWQPQDVVSNPETGADGRDDTPTLATAIQQQLGLKLQSGKGPLEVLVIDHADKSPVEN